MVAAHSGKGLPLNTQKQLGHSHCSPHILVSSELEEDCEAVLWACAKEGKGLSAGAGTEARGFGLKLTISFL